MVATGVEEVVAQAELTDAVVGPGHELDLQRDVLVCISSSTLGSAKLTAKVWLFQEEKC